MKMRITTHPIQNLLLNRHGEFLPLSIDTNFKLKGRATIPPPIIKLAMPAPHLNPLLRGDERISV